jgi:hypothetical protein
MGVAASAGYVCVAVDQDNLLWSADLTQLPFVSIVSTAIGQRPWSVAMTTLPGDGLVCAVYSTRELTLSVVNIPEMRVLRRAQISRLTPVDEGGWQLAIFNSGPAAGVAVLLSQADKILVVVNLSTGQEIGRASLSGQPFRIALDNPNGNVVVANFDEDSGLTRFVRVSSGRVVTQLNSTWDSLWTGFGVSADGTRILVANRDKFRILNNN